MLKGGNLLVEIFENALQELNVDLALLGGVFFIYVSAEEKMSRVRDHRKFRHDVGAVEEVNRDVANVIVTLRRTARQSVHSVCRIGRVVLQHGRPRDPLCSGYQDRPMRYFSPSDLCHEGSYVSRYLTI